MNSINKTTKDYYETNAPYISALARKDYDKLSELKEYKSFTDKKKTTPTSTIVQIRDNKTGEIKKWDTKTKRFVD